MSHYASRLALVVTASAVGWSCGGRYQLDTHPGDPVVGSGGASAATTTGTSSNTTTGTSTSTTGSTSVSTTTTVTSTSTASTTGTGTTGTGGAGGATGGPIEAGTVTVEASTGPSSCARPVHPPVPVCPAGQKTVLLGLLSRSQASPSLRGFELVWIQPDTGTYAAYPGPSSPNIPMGLDAVSLGLFGIDQIAHRLYLTGFTGTVPEYRLFTIDTVAGAVVASPLLAAGRGPALFAVNRKGVLLGPQWNDPNEELRAYDPSLGSSVPFPDPSTPQILAGIKNLLLGGSAYDVVADRLYIMGGDEGGLGQLFTVDTAKGLVISNRTVSPPANFTTVVDGYGRLLGIFWNGASEELRAIDPATGAHCPFPDPSVPHIVTGLQWLFNAAVAIDNDAGRMYVVGGETTDAPRLYVVDTVGNAPTKSNPTASFTAITVACH